MYRAKRIDNSEWVYGYYVVKSDPIMDGVKYHYILNQTPGESFVKWYLVCEKTVCRCTGLTDIHGTDIYEYDIVDCWSEGVNAKGTVQQRVDGLWIIYPAWQKNIMWGLRPDEYTHTTVKVIGNEFDNTELMESNHVVYNSF